jgi:ESS family glutamate:Na+ symporter
MMISPLWLLAAAVPVLLLGEFLVRRVRWLARFDVPVPVVGGFVVALAMLVLHATGQQVDVATKTSARWWTWVITAEPQWRTAPAPATPIYLPFSTAFFTCVGLAASWNIAKRGSWQLLVFLLLATVLAVLQNTLGIALAHGMRVSPYLGLLCGSVTLTGGPSTALGFAGEFEKAGFAAAATVGAAAAMFGIVTGSLLGGAVGGTLVRRHALRTATVANVIETIDKPRYGFINDVAALARQPVVLLIHLGILLACIKAGAWVSLFMRNAGVTFPVYMGAMVTGIVLRNLLDATGARIIRNDIIERIGAVTLGIFLAVAMSSLNLLELRELAAPMLVILACQVILTILFAFFVTFTIMGRDYDAAVMSAGHVGFGLGITANAVATMDVLVEKFGPSPRALLIVTIVGAFLIDLTNALTITVYLNLLK